MRGGLPMSRPVWNVLDGFDHMKLLFWNMGRNSNADLAFACMREHEVGVAAFAEHSAAVFADDLLQSMGYRVAGMGGCDKVIASKMLV